MTEREVSVKRWCAKKSLDELGGMLRDKIGREYWNVPGATKKDDEYWSVMASSAKGVYLSMTNQARAYAPTIVDFAEEVLANHRERFQGGKLIFIGGACLMPYKAAVVLAEKYGVSKDDIILVDMPCKTLRHAQETDPSLLEEHLRQNKVIDGSGKTVNFIDTWGDVVCKPLARVVEQAEPNAKANSYLMYSNVPDVDGYNRLPGKDQKGIRIAAVFLERAPRKKAIGYLIRDEEGVHPRYLTASQARTQVSEEFLPDSDSKSHIFDRKMASHVNQIILLEAMKRLEEFRKAKKQ